MRLGQKARSVGEMHASLVAGLKVNGVRIVPMHAPLIVQGSTHYMFDPHCSAYTDYPKMFRRYHEEGHHAIPVPSDTCTCYSTLEKQEITITIDGKDREVDNIHIPLIFNRMEIQLHGNDRYSIVNTYDSEGKCMQFYVLVDDHGRIHGVGMGKDMLAIHATRQYDPSMIMNLYALYGCVALIPIVIFLGAQECTGVKIMIVGICGFAGSGKDTIAKVFEEHGFRIMSFADILKDVVSLMYGLDRDLLSGKTHESRVWREQPHEMLTQMLAGKGAFQDYDVITPRIILQVIGTNVCRKHLGGNVWVRALEMQAYGMKIVCPDVRFQEERSVCNLLIHVVRPTDPIPDMHHLLHPSETEHLKFAHTADVKIDNDKTLQDLVDRARLIASS